MRWTDETSGSLFNYANPEARIPSRHPLRKIWQVVNDALAERNAEYCQINAKQSQFHHLGAEVRQ